MVFLMLKKMFCVEQTINYCIDKVNKLGRQIKINIKIFLIQKKLLKIIIKLKKIKII